MVGKKKSRKLASLACNMDGPGLIFGTGEYIKNYCDGFLVVLSSRSKCFCG